MHLPWAGDVQVKNEEGQSYGEDAIAESGKTLEVAALDAIVESRHRGLFTTENKTPRNVNFPANSCVPVISYAQDHHQLDLFLNNSSMMEVGPLAGLEVDFLAEVRVQEGEPLENALRRFKRKVQQEDIIKEVKRHSYYLKPGEKRRVKAALARKRNRKKARKEQD
jgi:small subunit ribosomal protein S21